MARPPLQAAHIEATKKLLAIHVDEYDKLVTEALASRGWAQQKVEKTVWRQT